MFVFIILFFVSGILYPQMQISGIRGMEDANGKTHILYRAGEGNSFYHSVFDLNTENLSDTLLLNAYYNSYPGGPLAKSIRDFQFWNKNTSQYIVCGTLTGPDNHEYMQRFDGNAKYFGGRPERIAISKQNDSILFAADIYQSHKSTDGGKNWTGLPDWPLFVSLSPFNDSVIFAEKDGKMVRSLNRGAAFSVVDSAARVYGGFYFDKDKQHVYYISASQNGYSLKTSAQGGAASSWSVVYSSPSPFLVAPDEGASGVIYIAAGKYVYRSQNYGAGFSQFAKLDKNINGLYAKPNAQKVYASTKYDIYELQPASQKRLKHIAPPPDIREWYPLEPQNTWVFRAEYWSPDPPFYQSHIQVRKVEHDSLFANQKKYAVVREYQPGDFGRVYYERVDTIEGKIFRHANLAQHPDSEYVIDDLLAEQSDTTGSNRFGSNPDNRNSKTIFEKEKADTLYGIASTSRIYRQDRQLLQDLYRLTRKIGMTALSPGADWVSVSWKFKGFVRKGVVYGDTATVTGIDDNLPSGPAVFSLAQNYPNPFNPGTRIEYGVGSKEYGAGKDEFVTLKIYDVLGKEVATLVNEVKPAGNYEVEFNGAGLPGGVYFYRLTATGYTKTKKMVLLR